MDLRKSPIKGTYLDEYDKFALSVCIQAFLEKVAKFDYKLLDRLFKEVDSEGKHASLDEIVELIKGRIPYELGIIFQMENGTSSDEDDEPERERGDACERGHCNSSSNIQAVETHQDACESGHIDSQTRYQVVETQSDTFESGHFDIPTRVQAVEIQSDACERGHCNSSSSIQAVETHPDACVSGHINSPTICQVAETQSDACESGGLNSSSCAQADETCSVTIEVQALNGETCTVEAYPFETAKDVKAKACEKLRLSKESYTLVYNRKELDDMSNLSSIDTSVECKFQLLPQTGLGLVDSVKSLFEYFRNGAHWLVEWFPDFFMDMSRALTEKDLNKISQAIGSGWQHLGAELGISQAEIEQISEDNKETSMKIFKMLRRWSIEASVNATVNTLHNAMKNCRTVTFNMKVIEPVFAGI